MKRASCFIVTLVFVVLLAALAGAGNFTGTVLEEGTGVPISAWGDIYAYRYNADTDEWVFENSDYFNEEKTTFNISGLQGGTYHLFMTTNGQYINKYYYNTTKYAKRNLVNLKSTQTRNLGTIYLSLLPVRMTNFQVTGSPVPESGGEVRVGCDVVNDTSEAKTVLVWPLYWTHRYIYNETSTYGVSEFARAKSVDVPANGSAPVEFAMEIRAGVPEGYHDIQLNCGYSRWTPLTPQVWAGTFQTNPVPTALNPRH